MAKKYSVYTNSKGQRIPGVTTVLGVLDKGQGLKNWLMKNGPRANDIMKRAGEYGDLVHGVIEGYISGQKATLGKDMAQILDNFKVTLEPHVAEWLMSEEKLISEKYQYGGTLDAVFKHKDGRTILLDVKTSNGMRDEYIHQLAAYQQALTEEKGLKTDEVWVILLQKEHLTWEIVYCDTKTKRNEITPFEVFLAARKIYRYREGL